MDIYNDISLKNQHMQENGGGNKRKIHRLEMDTIVLPQKNMGVEKQRSRGEEKQSGMKKK